MDEICKRDRLPLSLSVISWRLSKTLSEIGGKVQGIFVAAKRGDFVDAVAKPGEHLGVNFFTVLPFVLEEK